jgi:hypothetical protein
MDLIRIEGTPKLALEHFARHTPDMTIMQWFHFDDPRPARAVGRRGRQGVTHPREGLAMLAHQGILPDHTSYPKVSMHLADFRARMTKRTALARLARAAA